MSSSCPVCKKQFEEIFKVPCHQPEPFVTVDAMKGIKAYGSIYMDKQIVCQSGRYLHFRFLGNGEERLVYMEQFDERDLSEKHRFHEANPQPCQEEGCTSNATTPCYYEWSNAEPDAWFCPEHIAKNGFCASCGIFSAGWESFDFNPNGLCDNCQAAFEDELSEDDFDDYEDEYESEFE